METDALIKALSADARPGGWPMAKAWWVALALAAVVAAAVFFATLGPRPDFDAAVRTARFVFKFVVSLALAASAYGLLRKLSRPGAGLRPAGSWLLAAPVLLAVAVALELHALPSGEWEARLIGTNSFLCLSFIPLIGAGPLAVFLGMLRYGAPTRPMLAGAIAGLLAGGLAAAFYAAHCPDDSPLFVATWYSGAAAILAAAGALIAPRIARW